MLMLTINQNINFLKQPTQYMLKQYFELTVKKKKQLHFLKLYNFVFVIN